LDGKYAPEIRSKIDKKDLNKNNKAMVKKVKNITYK